MPAPIHPSQCQQSDCPPPACTPAVYIPHHQDMTRYGDRTPSGVFSSRATTLHQMWSTDRDGLELPDPVPPLYFNRQRGDVTATLRSATDQPRPLPTPSPLPSAWCFQLAAARHGRATVYCHQDAKPGGQGGTVLPTAAGLHHHVLVVLEHHLVPLVQVQHGDGRQLGGHAAGLGHG